MNRDELLSDLREVSEMNPDEHDGSYELMREIVSSYKTMGDYSQCNFRDLNAIYMMAIGTWKLNTEKKKEYVKLGHLPDKEKSRIEQVIDQIWDNARRGIYQNVEQNKPSIGMFGTGFYSFKDKTTDTCVQDFIKMLVDIADMQNDDEMFDRASQVLTDDFKGMRAASASVVLHCLKPKSFPILNGNMGIGNIFGFLGVNLKRPADIGTYIENSRQIKKFRDANFSIKNYRIFDQWAGKMDKYQDDEYIPSLREYDPGLSREQYEEVLTDENVIKRGSLDTLYYIYKMGGEASCTEVATRYGKSPKHYNANAKYVAERIFESTKCPLSIREGENRDRYWSILFQGRYANSGENGTFIWRIRKPLMDAIETIDDDGFFEEFEKNMAETTTIKFEKNTILYGPPGTGKTYNTVNYAVAICEGKSVKDVQDEDYDEVLKRYDELKKKGRIAFTTFHQSYGYEEFIEGIRPSVNDDARMVEYNVEDGIFKAFCDEATITEDDINLSATSYLVRLGYKENDLKDECFRDGVIRFDWDINAKDGGDASFYRWFSDMKQGDYVLSYHSESKYIDAIGVVTDDESFFDESKSSHRWTRRVNWMVRGLKEDIVGEFGGKWLSNFVISKIKWLRISDVLKVVRKYNGEDRKSNTKPYVFIIDEINRGNISKIFGELITLIEPSKRIGAKEAMEAVLPYSGGAFGVPDNVYIIGTMNTADRSIALMDTALRRRFNFVECMPDVKVLREKGADKVTDGSETIDVAKILEVMNERISYLYDREHTLGHAFFTPLRENPTVGALANIFKNKIIPLLQEYFYDDYEKIQLVLGDNAKDKEYRFILDEPIDETIFRKGTESLELDIQERKYSIQEDSFNSIESYKQIIG